MSLNILYASVYCLQASDEIVVIVLMMAVRVLSLMSACVCWTTVTEANWETKLPRSGIRPKKSRFFASVIIIWTIAEIFQLDILYLRIAQCRSTTVRHLDIVTYDVTNDVSNSAVLASAQLQRYSYPEYMCFGSSAMCSEVESGVLRGRPYGGVMTLVSTVSYTHLTLPTILRV